LPGAAAPLSHARFAPGERFDARALYPSCMVQDDANRERHLARGSRRT